MCEEKNISLRLTGLFHRELFFLSGKALLWTILFRLLVAIPL